MTTPYFYQLNDDGNIEQADTLDEVIAAIKGAMFFPDANEKQARKELAEGKAAVIAYGRDEVTLYPYDPRKPQPERVRPSVAIANKVFENEPPTKGEIARRTPTSGLGPKR